jgi:hypothetical protein
MKRQQSAAKRMLKGINQGTAARKMLSESNKFARKMSKRVKL